MKRVIALALFFSLLLLFTVEGVAYNDLERALRQLEIIKKEFRREAEKLRRLYEQEDALKQRKVYLTQLLDSCIEEFSSGIALEVIRGRYITAFEMCRAQEKNIDACLQIMREIKEKWITKCRDVSTQVLDYYYSVAMFNVSRIRDELLETVRELGWFPAALAGASEAEARMFPGTNFSFISGSGKVVREIGEIYFQGWKFVQFDKRTETGVIVQYFPNKINFVNGKYNIAFYFDPKTKHWEVIEVNLAFDAQTEKLLMALGQGVRVLDKEIIYMMDEFLRNTGWGLDLYSTSMELLLKNTTRRLVMESLFEYFAFGNYIAKVRAEEMRRSQPAETERKTAETERKTGTPGQRQKKK
jgi:hypothetical protein